MNIRDMIRSLARGSDGMSLMIGTVTGVDTAALTVDVEPLDGDAPVLGVNLQANQYCNKGVVVIPRTGSYVVVGMLTGYAAGVVLLTEDVAEVRVKTGETGMTIADNGIAINGGKLGGLINIEALTQALNGIVTAFNSHTHAGVNGGTSAPLTPMQPIDKDTYEDKKVTH